MPPAGHGYCLPSLRVKPILSGCIYRKAGRNCWSIPDTLLAQGVNHLWLDVQWYRRQALLKLDADSVRADILCRDMKGLLARLPGLETTAFNDGTPFADEVTLNWLNERVPDEMAGWQDEPVMAATSADEVLSLEPEVLTRADDEGIGVGAELVTGAAGLYHQPQSVADALTGWRGSASSTGKMKWRCICWRNSTAAPGNDARTMEAGAYL